MITTTAPQPDLSIFRPRFLAGLQRRVDELIALSTALDQREPLDAAMRLFHSIAGLAGTFGFHRLTTVCRNAEQLCAHSLETGIKLGVKERLAILETIMELRAASSPGLPRAA